LPALRRIIGSTFSGQKRPARNHWRGGGQKNAKKRPARNNGQARRTLGGGQDEDGRKPEGAQEETMRRPRGGHEEEV
jgi:hypothetical protein